MQQMALGIRQRIIHSGYGTKDWEDPWIPTMPARTARSIAHVAHPMIIVSDFIEGITKILKVEKLRDFITQEDIPLVQFFPTSQSDKDINFAVTIRCRDCTLSNRDIGWQGIYLSRNLMTYIQILG